MQRKEEWVEDLQDKRETVYDDKDCLHRTNICHKVTTEI